MSEIVISNIEEQKIASLYRMIILVVRVKSKDPIVGNLGKSTGILWLFGIDYDPDSLW